MLAYTCNTRRVKSSTPARPFLKANNVSSEQRSKQSKSFPDKDLSGASVANKLIGIWVSVYLMALNI
jgi:hypothetical protein